MDTKGLVLTGAAMLIAHPLMAQQVEFSKEKKAVVRHYEFPGNHREESMWSAVYGAKSGHLYAYDPKKSDAAVYLEGAMAEVADLGIPVPWHDT